jgi:tetratricopeptide (TPR) repeat protein
MLFKKFTNAADGNPILDRASSTKVVFIAIMLSLWLSACTSKSTVDESLKKATTTPLVTDEHKAFTDNSAQKNGTEEGMAQSNKALVINLYLQQQANSPLVIPANVLKNYQQAISLMKDKKWQQAQLLFDQVILAQPQLSGSYVNKAIIAKQQGKLIEAQVLLDKAITVNKLNLYAHHLQGKIYRLQGQFDKAEQSYLAALAIWPDFAEAHASMAILLELYRGRLLEAHGYYHSYLLLNSDDEEVKRWLAGLEIKIKRAGLEIPIVETAAPKVVEPKIIEAQVELQPDNEKVIDKPMSSSKKELDYG